RGRAASALDAAAARHPDRGAPARAGPAAGARRAAVRGAGEAEELRDVPGAGLRAGVKGGLATSRPAAEDEVERSGTSFTRNGPLIVLLLATAAVVTGVWLDGV